MHTVLRQTSYREKTDDSLSPRKSCPDMHKSANSIQVKGEGKLRQGEWLKAIHAHHSRVALRLDQYH